MSQTIFSKSNGFRIQARSTPETARPGGPLLALPAMLLRSLRSAWRMHCDEKLLQELSDHQLRDIGIRRGEIPHFVRRGGPEW